MYFFEVGEFYRFQKEEDQGRKAEQYCIVYIYIVGIIYKYLIYNNTYRSGII
jgi:hypothetical protein